MRNVNVKFFIILTLSVLFVSCSNVISAEKVSSKQDIAFTFSEDVVSEIVRTIQKNNDVTDNTQVSVECELVGVSSTKTSKSILLKDIAGTRFEIANVPVNTDFRAKIIILYNNIVIYEGVSDVNKVTPEDSSIHIKLLVEKKPCTIVYNLNNNGKNNELNPDKYYIDSQIALKPPVNTNSNLTFCGWYENADFSGDEVKDLGSRKFKGNITLYAKWIYNKNVSNFVPTRGNGVIGLKWVNPVANDFAKVVISCSGLTDVIEITDKTTEKNVILDNGKKYKFTVKSVNKDGFESEPVSVLSLIHI